MKYFRTVFLLLIINLNIAGYAFAVNRDSLNSKIKSKFEPLPILSYDTNDGFGYGGKAFFLNYLERKESFDLFVYRTTEGLQQYNLVFSIPDFELRQGKVYPWAADLVVDFSKWTSYKFYGVGNHTKFEDEEYYTRIRHMVKLTFSRGISKIVVAQIGLKYKSITNSNFESDGKLQFYTDRSIKQAYYYSVFLTTRYDTRDSFIHPSKGVVAHGESEFASGNITFNRWAIRLQYYTPILLPDFILASRLCLQSLNGSNLPIQVLLPIGSDNTVRGFPLDRFLDRTSAVFNTEIRFPLYWKFGGVIGLDAGKVWSSASKMDISDWSYNPTIGLRFYFDTFIVRADMGFSKETTGFYLNFGHIF